VLVMLVFSSIMGLDGLLAHPTDSLSRFIFVRGRVKITNKCVSTLNVVLLYLVMRTQNVTNRLRSSH